MGKLKRKPEQGNTSDGGRATKESKTYLLASHQAWAELESDMILGHADVVEAPGGEGAHVGASDSHSAAATRDASTDEQASGDSISAGRSRREGRIHHGPCDSTSCAAHYKIFGLLQRQKSVAKDPKMVAIVILLPIFFG